MNLVKISIKRVFDQVGYIINKYVPELYKSNLFKDSHIIEIVENDIMASTKGFEKYVNLKYLTMNKFTGILSPLKNTQLQELHMPIFMGCLTPIVYAPLKKIDTMCIKTLSEFYSLQID